MNNRIRKMIIGALLIALSIIIPMQFSFLKIIVPGFTATLASHVPLLIAMLISPRVAAAVGGGSALGFLLIMPGEVAARAAMHIIVGYVGGKMIEKGSDYKKAILFTAPLHGVLEALVLIPFGLSASKILITVVIGATIHHCVDGVIAGALAKALAKANKKDMYQFFNANSSKVENKVGNNKVAA